VHGPGCLCARGLRKRAWKHREGTRSCAPLLRPGRSPTPPAHRQGRRPGTRPLTSNKHTPPIHPSIHSATSLGVFVCLSVLRRKVCVASKEYVVLVFIAEDDGIATVSSYSKHTAMRERHTHRQSRQDSTHSTAAPYPQSRRSRMGYSIKSYPSSARSHSIRLRHTHTHTHTRPTPMAKRRTGGRGKGTQKRLGERDRCV